MGLFGVSCFTSPSSRPGADLAAPAVAPAAEHYPNSALTQFKETAAADLRSAADPVVPANHEWPLVCVSVPSLRGP